MMMWMKMKKVTKMKMKTRPFAKGQVWMILKANYSWKHAIAAFEQSEVLMKEMMKKLTRMEWMGSRLAGSLRFEAGERDWPKWDDLRAETMKKKTMTMMMKEMVMMEGLWKATLIWRDARMTRRMIMMMTQSGNHAGYWLVQNWAAMEGVTMMTMKKKTAKYR
jgi:hypothetical protein